MDHFYNSQRGKESVWKSYIQQLKLMPECLLWVRPVPQVRVPKLDLSFIEHDEIATSRKVALDKKAAHQQEIPEYKSRLKELCRIYGGSSTGGGAKDRKSRGVALPANVGKFGTDVKKAKIKKKRATNAAMSFIF